MGPGQDTRLALDLPKLPGAAAVGSGARGEDPGPELRFEKGLECLGDVGGLPGAGEPAHDVGCLDGADTARLVGLAVALREGASEAVSDRRRDLGRQVLGNAGRLEAGLGAPDRLGHFELHGDHLLVGGLAQLDGLGDEVVGKLLCAGLKHEHAFGGAGDDEVEHALFQVPVGGVDDEVAVDVAHPGGPDGTAERDVGDGESGGGPVDDEDVQGVLLVRGECRRHNLDVVAEPLGEEGAQGPVGEAVGQYGLGAGPPPPSWGSRRVCAPWRRASPRSPRSAGRSRCPPLGLSMVAVTRVIESPRRTTTAPLACRASLPVSMRTSVCPMRR